MKFQARVWKFGDNINTDLILPITGFYLTPQEQTRLVFKANRPGWVDEVQPGDILIGGKNFGMGSSRPAARLLLRRQVETRYRQDQVGVDVIAELPDFRFELHLNPVGSGSWVVGRTL